MEELDKKKLRREDNKYTLIAIVWIIVFLLSVAAISTKDAFWVTLGLISFLLQVIIHLIISR